MLPPLEGKGERRGGWGAARGNNRTLTYLPTCLSAFLSTPPSFDAAPASKVGGGPPYPYPYIHSYLTTRAARPGPPTHCPPPPPGGVICRRRRARCLSIMNGRTPSLFCLSPPPHSPSSRVPPSSLLSSSPLEHGRGASKDPTSSDKPVEGRALWNPRPFWSEEERNHNRSPHPLFYSLSAVHPPPAPPPFAGGLKPISLGKAGGAWPLQYANVTLTTSL